MWVGGCVGCGWPGPRITPVSYGLLQSPAVCQRSIHRIGLSAQIVPYAVPTAGRGAWQLSLVTPWQCPRPPPPPPPVSTLPFAQSQEPVFHFRPGDLPLERLVHMSKQQGHQRPGAVTLKSQGKRRGTLVQPCFRNWGMAADHVNFEDDLDKVAEQVGALVAEGDEDTDPEREPEAETEGAAPGLLVTVAGEPGPDASIGRADLPGAVSSGADHGQFLSGWWFGSSSPTTETHETAHAPHHLQSGSANAVWDRAVPRGRSGSQALVPPKAARRSRSMDTGSMSSLRRTSKFNIRSRSLEPHSLASSCLPATSAPSRKAQACASNASPARRACSLEEKHLDNGRSCAAARSRSWDPSQPVRFPSHTIGKCVRLCCPVSPGTPLRTAPCPPYACVQVHASVCACAGACPCTFLCICMCLCLCLCMYVPVRPRAPAAPSLPAHSRTAPLHSTAPRPLHLPHFSHRRSCGPMVTAHDAHEEVCGSIPRRSTSNTGPFSALGCPQ